MTTLETFTDVPWTAQPNTLAVRTGPVPDGVPVTAAHAFVLSDAGILLTRVLTRGWDTPGGHLEAGESVLAATAREVLEESGVELGEDAFAPLGYVELTITGPKPEGYRYPYPHASQAFFLARLDTVPPTRPDLAPDCDEARWFPLEDARDLVGTKNWYPLLEWALSADLHPLT